MGGVVPTTIGEVIILEKLLVEGVPSNLSNNLTINS